VFVNFKNNFCSLQCPFNLKQKLLKQTKFYNDMKKTKRNFNVSTF